MRPRPRPHPDMPGWSSRACTLALATMPRRMVLPLRSSLLSLSLAGALAGCAPALDWRDVPVSEDLLIQFPCRPERVERRVDLGGEAVAARMLSCEAGGIGWSVTVFDIGDPYRLADALMLLRRSLSTKLRAEESIGPMPALAALTPQPTARRLGLQGRGAEGVPVEAEALFAARGLQALQVVAIRRDGPASRWRDWAGEFIGSLHARP